MSIGLRDLVSLKPLAVFLAIPFFAAASLADQTFDLLLDVSLPPLMWVVHQIAYLDPEIIQLVLRCFIVVGMVGVILFGVTFPLVWLVDRVANLPVVGNSVLAVELLALPLLWIGLACITAGLLVIEVVIPGLPPPPLNPFWHLGLLGYGRLLIEFGRDVRRLVADR